MSVTTSGVVPKMHWKIHLENEEDVAGMNKVI